MMMLLRPACEELTLAQSLNKKMLQIGKNARDPASSPDFDFFVSGDFGGPI
jgi:hypothetical protein